MRILEASFIFAMAAFIFVTVASAFKTTKPQPDIVLQCYEDSKTEIIRKLRLHQQHISKLKGDREFDVYVVEFNKRVEEMAVYLNNSKIRFKPWKTYTGAVMEVREGQRRENIVNVNDTMLDRFRVSNTYTQQVLCHEISHLLWWTTDLSHPSRINIVVHNSRSSLCEYADWYNFLIIHAERQEELEKFYLTKA